MPLAVFVAGRTNAYVAGFAVFGPSAGTPSDNLPILGLLQFTLISPVVRFPKSILRSDLEVVARGPA